MHHQPRDFAEAARRETLRLRDEINSIRTKRFKDRFEKRFTAKGAKIAKRI